MRQYMSALLSLLLLCGLSGCQDPAPDLPGPGGSGTPVDTSDLPAPTDVPANGVYVLCQIYTIDAITPAGTISLVKTNQTTGVTETLEMVTMDAGRAAPRVEGTTLHELWVCLEDYDTEDYTLAFLDSEGTAALGVGRTADPFYRKIYSGDTFEIWEIDAGLRQYGYWEIIRHWEDTPPGPSYTYSGRTVDGLGTPLTCVGNVDLSHEPKAYYGCLFNLLNESLLSAEFSFEFTDLRRIQNEADLPNRDKLTFLFKQNFYSSYQQEVSFADLADTDLGDLTLYTNRELSFAWVYSADGHFTGLESPQTAVLPSVYKFDFADYTIADAYYTSLGDERNNAWNFNTYDLDGDDDADDFVFYQYPDGEMHLVNWVSGIVNLGSGELPMVCDATALVYNNYHALLSDPGYVYAVMTSAGGYALCEVTDIHTMTQAEMDPFLQ